MNGVPDSSDAGSCGPAEAKRAARIGLRAIGSPFSDLVESSTTGAPAKIERLDRPGEAYYLIPVVGQGQLRAVVEVNAQTCKVAKAGEVTDPMARFLIAADHAKEAIERATGLSLSGEPAKLGWRPCRESPDSFRPFWVFETPQGTLFVDQAGTVFRALQAMGKGG